MLQVVKIELQTAQHLLHGVGIAVVERRIRRDAGLHLVEIDVPWVVFHDLVDVEFALGTRSDERHVAPDDVPQLRQLVEARAPEETAHLRDARVVQMMVAQEASDLCQLIRLLVLEEVGSVLLSINLHASEFVDVERFSTQADSFLRKEHMSSVFKLDGKKTQQEQRREHHQGNECNECVDKASEAILPFAPWLGFQHILLRILSVCPLFGHDATCLQTVIQFDVRCK